MISYSIPVLLRARPLQLALWIVLAFTLPVYLVAPVLTGSVTWRPSLIVVAAPPGSTIHIPHVAGPQAPQRWSDWTTQDFWREQITRQAIGLANIAWWRGSLNNSSKRILANSANLSINSTINNVTLPYLHVSALEWIPNPEVVLTPAQLDLRKTVCANITLSLNSSCPLFFDLGAAGFVQDAPYAWGSELLPSASMMTETRLLVLYGAWRNDWSRPCEPRYINRQISKDFPENATFYPDDLLGQCWLFARVTYTAGVGTCSDCRISAYRTVQADDMDKLQDIRGDYMTSPALSMVPTVIGTLVGMNVSVPEAWESLDDYVAEFLRRSYAVSWAALTNFVGEFDPQLNTTYKVALPASQAQVNEKRVYIWLGIQLLITLSGLLFLTVQANLETPIMIDTTLAPFYLDSSELYEPENYQSLSDGALLRLRYEDGHMKVKIE
ncbi:hypothetical protein OPQ81_001112 [Rhizoctonia solani]|nr:hypothetical protein OPQ81_003289 [Rhizoctonia solani]KAJ1302295.1 hypothetical protein OPQ81_001112 [Rhizoctonia solani]